MWENVHRSREMFNLIEARPPPIDLLNLGLTFFEPHGSSFGSNSTTSYASCLVTFLARVTKCHIDQCFVRCAAQLRCNTTELQVKLMGERADARTSGPKHEQATKSDLITFVKRSIKWQMYFGNFHFLTF